VYYYNVCTGGKDFLKIGVANAAELEVAITDLKKSGRFSYIRGPFPTAGKAQEAFKSFTVYCEGTTYV